MDIKNKVAIITGGAGGIGVAIVKRLLEYGIKLVALFDIDNSNTKKIFMDLQKRYGKRVELYPCDVTNKAEFEENFDKVLKTHKTIDILFNNAGIGSDIHTELMIDLNYKAVVLGSILFIERLGKHNGGKGGIIVNTASILGLRNFDCLPVYCSTKHAIVSFTRCLDVQYNNTGVRVVAICPGLTVTPLLSSVTKPMDFIVTDIQKSFRELKTQAPECVADAVIKIIQKGKSGDVWVAEDSQAPYAVKDIGDYANLRISVEKEDVL
ncbi:hypothetical protein TSAR_007182 [Trichomalopsis sarcophagae]|uniref:15-hydroxyprostaglandin dehydrogenase n=1 Tax=Trichomalopsis sarcophagae TaxID=543379 RepID=A0A232FJT0_9HYME|nr:hypothetical protein TSAR_007182 [Trichomalopsis sarcophagae]